MLAAESSTQPLARATYQDHDLDDMDKVHDARKRSFYCNIALVAVACIALASVNILARYDYFDLKTITIINISALGLGAVTAFGSLLFYEKAKSNWDKETLLVAAVVLTVCATLSSLGLFKVFNTTQVTWTVFAPLIAAAGLAFWIRTQNSNSKNIAQRCFAIAIMTINVLALTGVINGTTLGIVNTAYLGSAALFSLKLGKLPDHEIQSIVTFLILGAFASISALGISGHLSVKAVAWTVLPFLFICFISEMISCRRNHEN